MNKLEIVKKVYKKEELQKKLEMEFDYLKRDIVERDYRVMGFSFCNIANILLLLGREVEANKYYEMSIEIGKMAPPDEYPTRSTTEALISLERYDEVSQILLTEGNWQKSFIAEIYEKKGDIQKAKKIFKKAAHEYEQKAIGEEWYLKPHYYQDASDLWEKAGDIERARELNNKTIQSWLELRNNLEEFYRPPIKLGWLYEEIGYIYEKADNFEEASKYYDAAEEKYKLAYSEEHGRETSAFKADQDWSYYVDEHFFIQMPEMFKWGFYMDYGSGEPDFKRIKYRKLLLEKEMKEKTK